MKLRAYLAIGSSSLPLKLLACVCLPLAALAQQNKLAVTPAAQISIKRGGTAMAKLRVMTLPGFHVNSDKPGAEFTIPLNLSWSPSPLQAQEVKYPKAEELKVGAETLSVFTGTFNITTEFKAPANASPGAGFMLGKIHYQACNTQMCFRPSTIDVRVPVLIE